MKKFLFFFCLLLLILPNFAKAQIGKMPFGGQIQTVIPCICSGNLLLVIGPPRGTLYYGVPFLYQPGLTKLYEFMRIFQIGAWVLGNTIAPGVCVTGPACSIRIPGMTMGIVGTSGGTYNYTPPPTPPPAPPQPPATSTPPTPSAACDPNTLAGWNFNAGISQQIGDASPELKAMLGCMCTVLKKQNITGTITSISDMDFIGNPAACTKTATRTAACDHAANSCHYGGLSGNNKSYAADIGVRAGVGPITAAAQQCGASAVINEGNHIHTSVPACGR